MFKRDVELELLPYCAEHEIGVVVYSPLQKGLLAGKFSAERAASLPDDDHRRNDPMFAEPQLSVNLAAVEKLKVIAGRLGITPAQLAISWTLRCSEVTSAIVGARRASQIDETIEAGDLTLSDDIIEEIEEVLREREEGL